MYRGQRNAVTDAKVSERYVEHQSSTLWETPSQPNGRWRWRWSENDEDGGKKWLEARSDWCHQNEPSIRKFSQVNGGNFPCSHLPCWFSFEFYKSTRQVTNLQGKFPPFHSCFLPLPSLFSASSSPPIGLTWCLPQRWTLVFNVSFTDFGVSNDIPLTVIYCARPVTLEFGLRTIPFGYLRSADWAQLYSVSLDPLASSKYLSYRPLGESIFFWFFFRCLTLSISLHLTVTHGTHFD
jgi:hypothetical protein